MPTHDSKRKRLSINMDKMAPGDDAQVDNLPANATIGERIVERTGREVKADKMRGVEEPMVSVAVPMATAARLSIPTAKLSVETALLFPLESTFLEDVSCPNTVDPRRQLAMKHEKTVPYGVPMAADESVANFAK